MTDALRDLLSLLDLEQLELNLFRGRSPAGRRQRVFGGQVIGQALVAACRTVEGRPPHSLHAYFLLGGDPTVPIIYEVDRIRDGKSFTTRRVNAIQHGAAIFSMAASFHTDEPDYDDQYEMPNVTAPEDLPSIADMRHKISDHIPSELKQYLDREHPIEIRAVDYERYMGKKFTDGKFQIWIRATGKLPDDPAIHHSVLGYASDLSLLDTALARYGRTLFSNEFMAASLDHAMWLHRPFRADDWLLYAQESPNIFGSRGYARGLVYRRDGTLVASVAQEGLIRQRKT